MKLTARDFRSLRQAADVADAQRELVELMKHRSYNPLRGRKWEKEAAVFTAALALIFVITLASVTQAPNSETVAENGAIQHIVSLD